MSKYVSVIRSKPAPEQSYTDEDIFSASDALNYFTFAICGNNTDLTIDVLIENLVSLISSTSPEGDHRSDISYYTGLFLDRLEDAFEDHDELMSETEDQDNGIDPEDDDEEDEDVPEEEDTNENPETSDAEPSPYRYPQHGIATALKVKVKGKDPMIIPIDCVGDILCDKHRKPGFCFCKLRNLGYPIPEDTSQIECVTTVRVSTRILTSHYDGYRVIITELPESVPDGQ